MMPYTPHICGAARARRSRVRACARACERASGVRVRVRAARAPQHVLPTRTRGTRNPSLGV